MADQAERDQKTESPTAKRRADAEQKGDVLQSKDLGIALIMAAGAAWLVFFGSGFVAGCRQMVTTGLTITPQDIARFEPSTILYRLLPPVVMPLLALFGLALLSAAAGPALLGSAGFRSNALAFKGSRINPVTGLARIFGAQGWVELGKSLIKAGLLGAFGYWTITASLAGLLQTGRQGFAVPLAQLGGAFSGLALALTGGLVLIAAIDAPVQILRRNARLRMTKQEVKEEMRQSEGAPELKQAVRQRQFALMNGSARKAVAEASVILTNPTHFAVALRYVPGKDFAPIVVARGRGETAQAIKTLAKEKQVPTLEYPKLTRAIYFTARAGQPVAEDLYVAVATILAFVFNLDRAAAKRSAQPDVIVPPTKTFDEQGNRAPL